MRAMKISSQVQTGPSSILGWVLAAAGLVTSTVLSLENSEALTTGPGKLPAILGVVALVATNAGRQFQAAHLTKAAAVAADVSKLPVALEALAAEAQANVAKVQASPDGVDSAAVPFAQMSGAATAAVPGS